MSNTSWNPNSSVKKQFKKPQATNLPPDDAYDGVIPGGNVISDLLGELASVISEKAKIESENEMLKDEINELTAKNECIEKHYEENCVKLKEDIKKLQENIKHNETNLIDSSKKCISEQRKNLDEIKRLKEENLKLKTNLQTVEDSFQKKIENYENKIKVYEESNSLLKVKSEENLEKTNKYKSKLKYAISIINELNTLLVKCTSKSNKVISTQTEYSPLGLRPTSAIFTRVADSALSCKIVTETEDMLLSDIFFKSKSFCDTELLL